MINRTMVRQKVVRTLFAEAVENDKTPLQMQKELLSSFYSVYSLYMLELDLIREITTYAQNHLDEVEERQRVLDTEATVNRKFADNRFAAQLERNRQLCSYMDEYHLSWDPAWEVIPRLYQQIVDAPCYQEYMGVTEATYELDKVLWRKIFNEVLLENETLANGLEQLEWVLGGKNRVTDDWQTDADVVNTYVQKTIRRFKWSEGIEQELLQAFDNEDELDFGKRLLDKAIQHGAEYDAWIEPKLQHWKQDRLALMDKIILRVALVEIMSFPDIAPQITLNEYLNIAREYSTEQSPQFINALLDEILKDLKRENKLLKAVMIK